MTLKVGSEVFCLFSRQRLLPSSTKKKLAAAAVETQKNVERYWTNRIAPPCHVS